MLTKHVVLVGLMGCGKTSVGKQLAQELQCGFFDIDQEIEHEEGRSISEIFETKGESYFREAEYEFLTVLLAQRLPLVLSPGGGAFIQERVRHLIAESKAVSVWLSASLNVLLERVSRKNTRPLLEKGNKKDILESLIKVRYPIYAQADICIESKDMPHAVFVEHIISKLKEIHAYT